MATADLFTPRNAIPPKDPTPRQWSADEFRRVTGLGIFSERTVILVAGQLIESLPSNPNPQSVVFTQKEYRALDDAGFFRD
jgi:hypothetical protein